MRISNSREDRLWTNTFLIVLRQGNTYFKAADDADQVVDRYHCACLGYHPHKEPNEPNEPAEPDEEELKE